MLRGPGRPQVGAALRLPGPSGGFAVRVGAFAVSLALMGVIPVEAGGPGETLGPGGESCVFSLDARASGSTGAIPSPSPSPSPTSTVEPCASIQPSPEPTGTVDPTQQPMPEPTGTVRPTSEPPHEPTPKPTETATLTAGPTATATATVEPTPTTTSPPSLSYLELRVARQVRIPLERGQANTIVVPVEVHSDVAWSLRLRDRARGPDRGHLVARPPDARDATPGRGRVAVVFRPPQARRLMEPFRVGRAPDASFTLVSRTGVTIATGTGDSVVRVLFSQSVQPADVPGTYAVTVIFQAIAGF